MFTNKALSIIFILLLVVLGMRYFLYQKNPVLESKSDQVEGGSFDAAQDKEKIDHDGKVRIVFLDIGQGDATYIEFPNGEQMLIDCAIDARILEALGRVMPYYDKTLDYLVVSHPDKDHYGGCIDVMERFEIKHILYNGYNKDQDDYWRAFRAEIDKEDRETAEYIQLDKENVQEIAGVLVHYLYPVRSIPADSRIPGDPKETNSNNTSIVMKISYGDEDVLLTADAELELEQYLVQTYGKQLDVEVYKVGHHGSNTSSNPPFLDAMTPEHAVISSGKDNAYGHPTPRILKRLERTGAKIWRTDTVGDVEMWMTTSSVSFATQK